VSKVQEGATSAIILNENGEILFLKRSEKDDFLPGEWDIPGGGLDYGETPEEGVRREILEECGLELEILKNLTVSTYYMGEVQRIDITFLCRAVDISKLKLSFEHTDYKWVKPSEVESLHLNEYINNIAQVAVKELV
jgi:8-oxo-dGTP diphosphatase